MSNSTDHAGDADRREDTERVDAARDEQSEQSLLPAPGTAADADDRVPDRYAGGDGETQTVAGRVPESRKQFIEDLVDVHPEFESTNALISAWVDQLCAELGEEVAERQDAIEAARNDF